MEDRGTGGFRRPDGVIAQEAHDQVVLLRLADGSYYTLDGAGATVWELCDGLKSFDEIVDAVADSYDASREVIRADVRELLDELLDERLLDRVA